VHDELERLLDDDEDMDKMYLTDKMVRQEEAQAANSNADTAAGAEAGAEA